MCDYWERLSLILLITLTPMLPALVLFKVLPTEADVSGVFKGFKIKLTGAFAGYFLVFYSLGGYLPAPALGSQHYVFRGDVRLGVDTAADPQLWHEAVKVLLDPPEYKVFGTGQVQAEIPYDPKARTLSTLTIQIDGCGSATVPVEKERSRVYGAPDYGVTIDHGKRLVTTSVPIVLKPTKPTLTTAAVDTLRALCLVTK